MNLDSHQHFWAINDTDYVWMTDACAPLRRDYLPEDLAPLLEDSGMDGCIAVQARQFIRETDFLLRLAEEHDFIKGVVGWIPLCEADVEAVLEQYASHENIVGFRHVVQEEPDDDFILRPDFNAGITALGNYPLTYDILIFERHLPQAIRFVDQHPGIPMVVDHIAKPVICRAAFDDAWARNIRELAKREQVTCKLSGLVTEVRDPDWDRALLEPYVDTVLNAFGPDRLMVGSDWPVCTLRSEYGTWLETVRALIGSLSKAEQSSIMGGTAQRVYLKQEL